MDAIRDAIWQAFLSLAGFIGFDTELLARHGPGVGAGLIVTFKIVIISMIIGALIAYPMAMMRMSKNRIVSGFAFAYIYFFRGTPLLAQVFLVYYGIGAFLGDYRPFLEDNNLWWFFREAFYYVLLAFALNTGAYQAEILRGGINSVPKGQIEAGEALGLTRSVIFRKIVLPQALIIALRPFGNELILMIKASAVASIVTVLDVMGATKLAFSRSYDFQTYLWAAIIYLVLVETIRRVWDALEWRMTRHLRPATQP
jgi:polar amino acid transport system permease protein